MVIDCMAFKNDTHKTVGSLKYGNRNVQRFRCTDMGVTSSLECFNIDYTLVFDRCSVPKNRVGSWRELSRYSGAFGMYFVQFLRRVATYFVRHSYGAGLITLFCCRCFFGADFVFTPVLSEKVLSPLLAPVGIHIMFHKCSEESKASFSLVKLYQRKTSGSIVLAVIRRTILSVPYCSMPLFCGLVTGS